MMLLEKYGVRYVVVGVQERQQYPPESLQKFEDMFEATFQQGNVAIYLVTPQPEVEARGAP
jgi:uncharacterized membrane protein